MTRIVDPSGSEPGPATVARLVGSVRSPSGLTEGAARAHLDGLAKPPGSLGRLEDLAVRLARITGPRPRPLRRRALLVAVADHGVSRRGVSAYPREVTSLMCRALADGGAAAATIARTVGTEVVVLDVGVDADTSDVPGIVQRKVRRGTRDLSVEAALTAEEAAAAMDAGASAVRSLLPDLDVLALGEMGIGNTTSAAALAAALLGLPAERLVGPGTGVDGPALESKREVVRTALHRTRHVADPLALLAELGGLELAALAGACLAGAAAGVPVVTDGFIASTAVLAAVRMCPPAADYVMPSHRSAEPGHGAVLDALGLEPLLELDLRLGEGTGALLALPLLEAAAAVLRDMATLADVGASHPGMGDTA